MSFAFDRETAVEAAGEHRWSARITPHWNIGDKPNGGYLMAVLLQALHAELAADAEYPTPPDPVTVTAHFLRPGVPGADGVVDARTLKRGRSLSSVQGSLVQDGVPRVHMVAGFGTLPDRHDGSAPASEFDIDLAAPSMPPFDHSMDRSELNQGVDEMSLLGRVEMRLPQSFADAAPNAEARVVGWIRHRDGRPPDSSSLPLFADAFPPPVFARFGSIGWVPTLEMTVHVRSRPAPGWLIGQFEVDDLVDGRFVETGALWDSEGQLVARSRQLGMLLT